MAGNTGAVGVADLLMQGQRLLEQPVCVLKVVLAERQGALLVGEERLSGPVARRSGRIQSLAERVVPGFQRPTRNKTRSAAQASRSTVVQSPRSAANSIMARAASAADWDSAARRIRRGQPVAEPARRGCQV